MWFQNSYHLDKDDQLKVVRLTSSQALSIAKQIESLNAQLQTMDQMNSVRKSNDHNDPADSQLQAVFLGLKPFTDEMLRSLIKGADR